MKTNTLCTVIAGIAGILATANSQAADPSAAEIRQAVEQFCSSVPDQALRTLCEDQAIATIADVGWNGWDEVN